MKTDVVTQFIHVRAYVYFARLQRGRVSRNRLASLDTARKYEIIV